MSETAVFLLVLHISLLNVSGRGLPDRGPCLDKVFVSESECRKCIAAVSKSLEPYRNMIGLQKVSCERMEIKR